MTQTIFLPWEQPVNVAHKLQTLKYMIWLDSNIDSKLYPHCEFDIITADPEMLISIKNNQMTILHLESLSTEIITKNYFAYLEQLIQKYTISGLSQQPFHGGLAGYWSYEMNHYINPYIIKSRDSEYPEMILGLYLWSLIFDHRQKKINLCIHPQIANKKIKNILNIIDSKKNFTTQKFKLNSKFTSQLTFEQYTQSFNKITSYLKNGDCYQINLTQKFSSTFSGSIWTAYQKIRQVSPTPYSAYLNFDKIKIMSYSPERFLNIKNNIITTKPIKGTQPRYKCKIKNQQSIEKLLSSKKDQAENLMIVDLMRNDLHKNCQIGSVYTKKLFALESYANVHHLVSTINGKLKTNITPLKFLQNAFPGGSITGVPKIRAMQIIRELEPMARSVYCGAIGYISFNGNMDTNIPIRTFIAHDDSLHCWGGGAIVYDSTLKSEYNESIIKIRHMTQALENNFM